MTVHTAHICGSIKKKWRVEEIKGQKKAENE